MHSASKGIMGTSRGSTLCLPNTPNPPTSLAEYDYQKEEEEEVVGVPFPFWSLHTRESKHSHSSTDAKWGRKQGAYHTPILLPISNSIS